MFGMRFDMRLGTGAPRASYTAALDMVTWAESRFAPVVILSEHHGVEGGYLPSPGVLAAAMAARTTTTYVIVAATVLPLHNPVRLAEDIAVADHLSGGRVGWVLAAGYRPEEFDLLGIDFDRRGALMDENLAILLDALDGGGIHPPPETRPQLFIGGGGRRAARRAAQFGLGLFAQTNVGGLGEIYAQECALQGVEPGMCVLPSPDQPVSVFVADDVDRAWDEIGPYLLSNNLAYAKWNDDTAGTASMSPATTVDELRAEKGAYRILTVDEAVELATDETLTLHPMCGGLPPEIAWPYLERVATEVAPAVTAG